MKLQTWLDYYCACIYLCENLAINLCPKIVKTWNDFLISWPMWNSYVDVYPNEKNKVGRAAMPWHIATHLWCKPKGDQTLRKKSELGRLVHC